MNSWVLDGFCSTDRYPRSGSVVCFCRYVQKTPSTRRKSRKRFRFKQTEIKKRFSLTDEHQSAARTTERICELEVVSLQGNVSDPYNDGNQRYFIFLWWKKSSAPFFVSYCEIPNKGWFPYDRKRSQTIAGSQTIADDRRRSQKIEHGSIFCDRLRSRSQDRRRSQKCVSIWSQTIAELSAICDPRCAIVCDHMETSLKKECNLGMRKENFSWPANEMETGSLFSASSWKCFGQTFQSNCFCWYLAVQTF